MSPCVLVEVRPLVQACWVYLITPSKKACAQVTVRPNDLTVTWSEGSHNILSQTVSLSPDVPLQFQPCQVSSLLQDDKHISFRVQTSPRNLTGSFLVQYVESKLNCSVGDESAPNIPTNEPCQILCACCKQNVLSSENLVFKRVLPLPSGPYDAADFFCHNHGNSGIDANPNEADFLFSNFGFQLHPSLLECKRSVLHCRHCLTWIGTSDSSKVCLWFSTVDVRPVSDINNEVKRLYPTQEFFLIIQQAVRQCPTIACRLLLNVKVELDVSHYLLINVIDRDLTLLIANATQSQELISQKAMKVSFQLEKRHSGIVSLWLDDPFVNCIDLALPVFTQGMKHLLESSCLIPCAHRKVQNEFLLAYLCSNFIDGQSNLV